MNLKGMWLTTKYVVPHMIERRYGKIVMTSSRNGLRASRTTPTTTPRRPGVIVFAKSLAIELGPTTINVNAVCPGQMADRAGRHRRASRAIRTGTWSSGKPGTTYAEFDAASGRENLFEEGGQIDFGEVAEAVLWLASDRAHMVTGHALPSTAAGSRSGRLTNGRRFVGAP